MSDVQKLPERQEVPDDLKWNLADIFASDEAWEDRLRQTKERIGAFTELRGKLDDVENLISVLKLRDELGIAVDQLIAYALMHRDENNADPKYQAYADRAVSVSVQLSRATAFIEPELLEIPDKTIQQWLQERQELGIYRHYLEDVLRTKPHTLPTEQEELLAGASEMAQAAGNIYQMFNNADLTFPTITDENGKEVELTHGRYISFLENKDRRVRRDAFQAMYSTYGTWKNTLAAAYISQVKTSLFYAQSRRYQSSLEAALDANNVPTAVYDNLLKTVEDSLPLFHRYMGLRKRLLSVDELHLYDVYVPLVSDIDMKIPYQQAKEMVREGLRPLGEQYISDLEMGFQNRWIDWLESKGKTSGAYSWGAYGVHPFVLMNYQENIDNMFTLAHEMGHALHSFYSEKNQAYVNSHYSIFVAEVASTVNEALVMADLLAKTSDPKQKKYLLNHYLDQFRGTLFRQAMFAKFEKEVHQKVQAGEAMTPESLCNLYYQLNEAFFGPEVVVDQEIAMEWARIPHFYRPFYVYQYATGFSAAVALSQQILTEGQPAIERYLQFLGSGGSDYPINQLKAAGVDMASPQPVQQAMRVFESLLAEMEELS